MVDNKKGEDYTELCGRATNYFKNKSAEIANNGGTVIIDMGLWTKHQRDEIKDFFKKNDIHVALSIYSYNAEEHDKVTLKKGSHNKTVHTVKLLKEYDIPHRIATVYMKDIFVGEKITDLYTLNPDKDVIRMAGRGNIGLLTPELLKRKLITKETFSHALNPQSIACHVSGNRCFA